MDSDLVANILSDLLRRFGPYVRRRNKPPYLYISTAYGHCYIDIYPAIVHLTKYNRIDYPNGICYEITLADPALLEKIQEIMSSEIPLGDWDELRLRNAL